MRYVWIVAILLIGSTASAQEQSFADLAYPFETDTLTLGDSLDIAYVDTGSAEKTILFIHGLGSYLSVWKNNLPELQKSFRCIAVDLPGYGKSGKSGLNISLKFYSEILAAFLQQLEVPSATVAGHSMGGQIAMTLALQHPERVEKLLLLAPAGLEAFSASEKEWFKQILTAEAVALTPENRIRANIAANFHQMPQDANFLIEERLMIREAADFGQYCSVVAQSVQAMLNEPVLPRLAEIEQPVLILFGENDKLIPNTYLHPKLTIKDIAAVGDNQCANSKVVIIPEAGHFLMFEKAAEVNREIENFLR